MPRPGRLERHTPALLESTDVGPMRIDSDSTRSRRVGLEVARRWRLHEGYGFEHLDAVQARPISSLGSCRSASWPLASRRDDALTPRVHGIQERTQGLAETRQGVFNLRRNLRVDLA